MHPLLSPLPPLRVVTAVMALLAMFFAAQLMWQRYALDQVVENRYKDAEFQSHLFSGLQWLEGTVQAGPATEQPTVCPHKANEETSLKEAQLQCARAALNAKLATASTPHHILENVPDETLQRDVLKAMQWLTRNASDGNHALTLLRNPERAARQNSLPDPFRLAGCLFAGADRTASQVNSSACLGGASVTDTDLPPDIQDLLYPVQRYRAAIRSDSPNSLQWEPAPGMKTPLAQGRHVTVAWVARAQTQAQTTAACYAGDSGACRKCTWCNTAPSGAMFESARTRAIGILIVDVKTGAIEAAASAYTPCYAAQQNGERTLAGCPLLPSTISGKRPESSFRLGSQSLLQTAMPGSQAKVPIALGLMQSGLSAQEVAALPSILTRSATEELIDIVLCRAQDFLPSCAQHRLFSIANVAHGMGWVSRTDILTLGQIKGLNSPQFAGRLMQLPVNNGSTGAIPMLDRNAMRQCGFKPVQERWRNCHSADLVNTVAELFGQGNALTSPVGIANGLLQLAAAGNGETASSSAHLLAAAQDSVGINHIIKAGIPLTFQPASARPVLLGLSHTHTEGTARSACQAARIAVNGVAWAIPCSLQTARDSKTAILRIASKTGTPVFSADRLTLPQWRASCVQTVNELASTGKGQKRWYYLRNEFSKCQMAPIKWYAMLVGQPDTKTWDKVVVVIAERNWNRTTQIVDSARDIDANVAAEAGLVLANVLYAKSDANVRSIPLEHNPEGQP